MSLEHGETSELVEMRPGVEMKSSTLKEKVSLESQEITPETRRSVSTTQKLEN